MLSALTVLIMLMVAYAFFREGLFTAVLTLVNIVLAGLIAFNFWEPVAGLLDSVLDGSFLDGFQDFVILMLLFAVALGLLRLVTNNLAFSQIEFSPVLQQFGGAGVGLLAGYVLSGFFVSAMETLPWNKAFIDFQPRSVQEGDFRRMFPPDRVWLALMRHAGAFGFARGADNVYAVSPYDRCPTFDRAGTFELRYYRYRRHTDNDPPMPYLGELERDLNFPIHVPPRPATQAPAASPATPNVQQQPIPLPSAPKTAPEEKKAPLETEKTPEKKN